MDGEGGLASRKVCDGDREYKLFSTGLGLAPVSFTVTPTDSPTEVLSYNTPVLGSQFVRVSFIVEFCLNLVTFYYFLVWWK